MRIIFLLDQTEHVPTGFLSEAVCSLSLCSGHSMEVRVLKVFKGHGRSCLRAFALAALGSSSPTCRCGSFLSFLSASLPAILLTGNIAWAELFSLG